MQPECECSGSACRNQNFRPVSALWLAKGRRSDGMRTQKPLMRMHGWKVYRPRKRWFALEQHDADEDDTPCFAGGGPEEPKVVASTVSNGK
jgi:hypothetical protein